MECEGAQWDPVHISLSIWFSVLVNCLWLISKVGCFAVMKYHRVLQHSLSSDSLSEIP